MSWIWVTKLHSNCWQWLMGWGRTSAHFWYDDLARCCYLHAPVISAVCSVLILCMSLWTLWWWPHSSRGMCWVLCVHEVVLPACTSSLCQFCPLGVLWWSSSSYHPVFLGILLVLDYFLDIVIIKFRVWKQVVHIVNIDLFLISVCFK